MSTGGQKHKPNFMSLHSVVVAGIWAATWGRTSPNLSIHLKGAI